jgi:hypothetical protein
MESACNHTSALHTGLSPFEITSRTNRWFVFDSMATDPSSFGFVTACHVGDRHLVTATLASIRHYCPDVPVCLLVDGSFDVTPLEQDFQLIVLRTDDIEDSALRKLVSGNYRIKQLAMWRGPFDHYVWLDSDAILWGDIRPFLRPELDFQVFWSGISIPSTHEEVPEWLGHYYFNLEALFRHDPEFEWRGHPYFSAGTYACRKNVFGYEKWLELEEWQREEKGDLFRFGDQGILNYLVHSSKNRGRIRSDFTDLQHVRGMSGDDELKKDCAASGWRFPDDIARPRIVHFCGEKPYIFNARCYSRPYTIARLESHRARHGKFGAWAKVLGEDGKFYMQKAARRLSPQ